MTIRMVRNYNFLRVWMVRKIEYVLAIRMMAIRMVRSYDHPDGQKL